MSLLENGQAVAEFTMMGPPGARTGAFPPHGICVEFDTFNSSAIFHGVTAQLGCIGPELRSETVLVATDSDEAEDGEHPLRAFFMHEIRSWRQVKNPSERCAILINHGSEKVV